MAAIGINVTGKETGDLKHIAATITILDGKKSREYQLFVTPKYVTVETGFRCVFGKTFHNVAECGTHYKRDGVKLLEIVRQFQTEMAAPVTG